MRRLREREEGQSLIIVAVAIMTLMAFVGLAIDLGIVYVERIRVQRAVDAAALAGAPELPLEPAAHLSALQYLEDNGYGCGVSVTTPTLFTCTNPNVRLEINGSYIWGPAADAADIVIKLNTVDYRDLSGSTESADRIRVEVTKKAPIYFMKLFGFGDIPVHASAVAENISNLDMVLVFDKSGSMEFDTLCYGCWTPNPSLEYPDGNRYPLLWDGNLNGQPDQCEGNAPLTYYGNTYIIIEAEDYSYLSNPYNRELYTPGYTYWVLERNGPQAPYYMGNAHAYGRDVLGAYISYMPERTAFGADGLGIPCNWTDLTTDRMCSRDPRALALGGPYPAPRVDYEFTVPSTGNWYFWIRGEGGDTSAARYVFWGLNGTPVGAGRTSGNGGYYNGALSYKWEWIRLGCGESASAPCAQYLQAGQTYTLNLWGGGVSFDVDRIIITDYSGTPPSSVMSSSHIDNNRTGWACDPCDARYGGSPAPSDPHRPICTADMAPQPYRYLDDIYDDEQPIRGAVEAAKNFVDRLDPSKDQIGYVSYSSYATINSELQCVRRLGTTFCTEAVIDSTVIHSLDNTHAGGSTNIAHGIAKGIDVLSNTPGHFGRPGAAHIMIVMTDGEANQGTNYLDPACDDEDLWPYNTGNSHVDSAKDCVVYYAMRARNNGIIIYTITLGNGADIELMQYIAELTGGIHRHAPRPEQLDPIFDELFRRIFLRLVQ